LKPHCFESQPNWSRGIISPMCWSFFSLALKTPWPLRAVCQRSLSNCMFNCQWMIIKAFVWFFCIQYFKFILPSATISVARSYASYVSIHKQILCTFHFSFLQTSHSWIFWGGKQPLGNNGVFKKRIAKQFFCSAVSERYLLHLIVHRHFTIWVAGIFLISAAEWE